MSTSISDRSIQTAWTIILAGRSDEACAERQKVCWDHLAEIYSPLLNQWGKVRFRLSPEQLDDLVQSFFLRLMEGKMIDAVHEKKGRFRHFLRVCFQNFVLDELRASKKVREKQEALKLENGEKAEKDEPSHHYERAWALKTLQLAVEDFRSGCEAKGLGHYWRVFERHIFRPEDFDHPSAKQSAKELEVKPKDIENWLKRARAKFSKHLRARVRQTVNCDDEVDEEIRHLRQYFSRSGS